mmetsp:Transcript_4862/g.8938  ORF Transcript_4862/g.8938 Transcript_4862/m.8938 type:complete len:650 (+) Transcript_4862:80-2029(+)
MSSSSNNQGKNSNSNDDSGNANNNMDDDHQLSQFLSVTGSSDATIARQYLEMSGNNLEMAVGLFLEHGAGGMAGGGDGGVGSASAAAGAGAAYHHASEVRAPDQTRTMRLMDFDDGPSPAVLAALGGRGGRHALAALGGVGMGGMMGENAMDEDDDLMAMRSTWAALDEQRQRRPASNASSGGGASGGSGRGIGSEAGRNPRRAAGSASGGGRRRTGSTNNSSNNGDDDDDDDDVQVVNPDGQRVEQDNAEDDNHHHHDDDDDDQDSYHYDDESDDDSYHAANGIPRAPTNAHNAPSLSEIFAPPTHLIHRAGGFLGAKAIAKDTRRWLLVNIQNDSDFACHALNRDVWRDELVENLVREGFVFWQASNTTAEGRTYVERYKVAGYPHLGILDPRTGKLLWRKEGWTQVEAVTAEMFVEMASDFCSRHSFDRMPTLGGGSGRGRPAGYGSGGNTASGSGGSSSHPMDVDARSGKRPIHELSEEEQLQAAIRASMQPDNNDSNGDGDGDNAAGRGMDDSVEIVDIEDDSNNHPQKGGEGKEEEEEEGLKKPSFETDIRVMAVGDEPAPGAGELARVQIRMPDGKRLVRKFRGKDTIKVIYAFVAQNNDEAKGGKEFELKAKFPPQDLFPSVNDTISSCGLSGEAINVIWK